MVAKKRKKRTVWTEKRIRTVALKYKTHAEFRRLKAGAYQASKRLCILDDVCSHMPKMIDNINTVYMWSSKQYPNVWKIGVSTAKSISLRVNKVAELAKLDIDFIFYAKVENARKIESEILSTYKKQFPFYRKFDGCTEFRVLSDDELEYIKETFGITRDDIKPVNDVLLNKGKEALRKKKKAQVARRNTINEWVYERIIKEIIPYHTIKGWKLFYPSSLEHKHLMYYIRHICDDTSYIFEINEYSISIYDDDGDIDEYTEWLRSIDFSDDAINEWAESVNPPIQRKQNTIIHSKKWHTVSIPLENNDDEAYDAQSWCTQNIIGLWGSHKRVPIWEIDIELEWQACVVFYFDCQLEADKFSDRWEHKVG